MPGYQYGDIGTGDIIFYTEDRGELLMRTDKISGERAYESVYTSKNKGNIQTSMRWFQLGTPFSGSPTAEIGNNESKSINFTKLPFLIKNYDKITKEVNNHENMCPL